MARRTNTTTSQCTCPAVMGSLRAPLVPDLDEYNNDVLFLITPKIGVILGAFDTLGDEYEVVRRVWGHRERIQRGSRFIRYTFPGS